MQPENTSKQRVENEVRFLWGIFTRYGEDMRTDHASNSVRGKDIECVVHAEEEL
jgi:hypothetical protein